jgi:hypothetical protein
LLKVVLLGSALGIFASVLGATVLLTGTPNLSGGSSGMATGLSPKFGTLISFDDLTPNSLLSAGAYLSSGVSSISATNSTAALSAVPVSGQTQPNYIGPADFSDIDILISFLQPTDEAGIGLLAGSSNSFRLTARNAANTILGTYIVNVPDSGVGAFNGYYAIQDVGLTIKSLEISGNGGIDDLQFDGATGGGVPEPSHLALLGGGLTLLTALSKYRRKP